MNPPFSYLDMVSDNYEIICTIEQRLNNLFQKKLQQFPYEYIQRKILHKAKKAGQ